MHEKDLELMETIRRPATRLGFALQLVSLRFLGTFILDLTNIPQNVLSYVATQLNIDPGEIIYYSRRQTRYQHTKLIKSHYGYQDFNQPEIETYLANWLLNRALYTTESSDMLFDMLLKNVWMKRLFYLELLLFLVLLLVQLKKLKSIYTDNCLWFQLKMRESGFSII